MVVVAGGPRLGDFEAGVVASLTTPTISVVSGGLACIGGVVAIAALVPEFARYEVPAAAYAPPHAAPRRRVPSADDD